MEVGKVVEMAKEGVEGVKEEEKEVRRRDGD